jgi:hypothetical protein
MLCMKKDNPIIHKQILNQNEVLGRMFLDEIAGMRKNDKK